MKNLYLKQELIQEGLDDYCSSPEYYNPNSVENLENGLKELKELIQDPVDRGKSVGILKKDGRSAAKQFYLRDENNTYREASFLNCLTGEESELFEAILNCGLFSTLQCFEHVSPLRYNLEYEVFYCGRAPIATVEAYCYQDGNKDVCVYRILGERVNEKEFYRFIEVFEALKRGESVDIEGEEVLLPQTKIDFFKQFPLLFKKTEQVHPGVRILDKDVDLKAFDLEKFRSGEFEEKPQRFQTNGQSTIIRIEPNMLIIDVSGAKFEGLLSTPQGKILEILEMSTTFNERLKRIIELIRINPEDSDAITQLQQELPRYNYR